MPYLGRSPGSGVRSRFIYAATSGQTSFSGNDSNSVSLAYEDTLYMDVYQNGVLLKPVTDYAATTGTSVVLTTGATTDDVVEMIVYDTFAVADTVSASNGGTFSGNVSAPIATTSTSLRTPLIEFTDGDDAVTIADGGLVTVPNSLTLTSGFTATDGCTITTADNSAQLTLTSTDADATGGPILDLIRDSSSPADNDIVGLIRFRNDNSAGDVHTFGLIQSKILDATDGSEDMGLEITMNKDGTNRSRIECLAAETVFNEDSQDIDFRVESNGNANMINVDAGNDLVGIGMVPDTSKLTVNGQIGTTNGTEGAPTHSFYSDVNTGMFRPSGDHLGFSTGGTERLRIDNGGTVLVGGISAVINSDSKLGVHGRIDASTSGTTPLSLNRSGSDGVIIDFLNDGTAGIGNVSVSGSNVAFNTSSDYRLKENVTDMTGAIDRVKALLPKRFNFIRNADKVFDGFLAHEAQAVVPEAVTGTKDGMRDEKYEITPAVLDDAGNEVTPAKMGTRSVVDYQGIDQSKLVPLLTGALQEAIAKIETLEAKVTALENS